MRLTCYFCKCATPCWSKEQEKDPFWLTNVGAARTYASVSDRISSAERVDQLLRNIDDLIPSRTLTRAVKSAGPKP